MAAIAEPVKWSTGTARPQARAFVEACMHHDDIYSGGRFIKCVVSAILADVAQQVLIVWSLSVISQRSGCLPRRARHAVPMSDPMHGPWLEIAP
jgi:hypothetical protein